MEEDESTCEYVNSAGILKSCDIHSPNRLSGHGYLDPSVYGDIPAGKTVYVTHEAIANFMCNFFDSVQGPIVLVSGDSDSSFPPEDFDISWLEDAKIIHWFAQNCTIKHPKVTSMPIGLDYHTVAHDDHPWSLKMTPKEQEKQLKQIAATEPLLANRDHRAYGNFLLNITRGNRKAAYEQIPKEVMVYEEGFVPRGITWTKQATMAFTVSPLGNGLDCHRTWETLALGGIPIVETSVLDCLYEGLPVLIVQKWSDITEELLEKTLRDFSSKTFEMERLTLEYWVQKIKTALQ